MNAEWWEAVKAIIGILLVVFLAYVTLRYFSGV